MQRGSVLPIQARTLVVQGLRLRVWDHGGEGLPRALFVHGYLDTGRSFDAVAHELRDEVHCLALDWRGHGQSDRVGAGGSYHLLDHLKDLSFVLHLLTEQSLGIDVLVAHSMGGNIALLLAGATPAAVPALVLVDSLGAPPEDPAEQPARIAEVLSSLHAKKRAFSPVPSIEAARDRLRAMNAGLSEAAALRMVEHALVPRSDGGFDFPFDPQLRGPTPVRWAEETWLEVCRRAVMPVVLLRAADGYLPGGNNEHNLGDPFFARLTTLRRGRCIHVAGGHHLHVERPDAIAQSVRDLIPRN